MVLITRHFALLKRSQKTLLLIPKVALFSGFLAYCVAFSQAKLNEYVFIFYIIGQDIDNTSENKQNFPYCLPRILVQFRVCA